MSRNVSIYLTVGRPGRETTLCRLDNPDNWLIREVAQRAYSQLLSEAQELANKEDSEVGRIKMKSAWLLRTTLESILPDLKLETDGLPQWKKKDTN